MFAIFASILMLTIVAVPMVAAEDEYEYCDEAQSPTTDFTFYDLCGAEIEIIDGLPYIVVEFEDECINIPFPSSNSLEVMADGVPITVEVDGNYLLIPTEYGIERVCISEFDIEIINEQLMMVHEINAVLSIIILKLGITTAVSTIYIWVLESATGRNICGWCELDIKLAGASATFLWSCLMKKVSAKFAADPHINAVIESIVGTIACGVLARSIAFTARVIGTCGNTNCLFHRNNH
jgi:hypothetical protein